MVSPQLVLVADDQPNVLLTLQFLVKSVGNVEVITANNGADAVKLAVERKPQLILMDVMMPQLDGYAACQKIREAWGDQHHGTVWFITARDRHADLDQAKQVGADRLINKPFDPDQIVKLVREVLGRDASTVKTA